MITQLLHLILDQKHNFLGSSFQPVVASHISVQCFIMEISNYKLILDMVTVELKIMLMILETMHGKAQGSE